MSEVKMEVRQHPALSEIMAALKELSEADKAITAALEEFNAPAADREAALDAHNRASDRFCAANDALIALYERLK